MNGGQLSPVFSAELASNVYLVKDKFSRKGFTLKYKDCFDMEESTMVSGNTGAFMVVKKPHIMAFMGMGKGEYEGQAFVAVKGTASLYDALTDLNVGVHLSHTGFHVHQGFYYAFDSILDELKTFIGGLEGVNVVHCIGHSLGGAIATLAADWIRFIASVPTVKLYTFGSPRVGLEGFSAKSTSRLLAKNIHRVYHRTDPVTMAPTWPYYHIPNNNLGCLIDSPVTAKPWEYHLMKHYINSAKKAGNWKAIENNRPKGHLDAAVERWLKSDGVLTLTVNTMDLLDAALLYVIKKVTNLAGISLITAASGTLTLLDRMAMFMAKAVKISSDLSLWVYRLVKKMASVVGVVVKEGVDLTVTFIRHVFIKLHLKLVDVIWRAGKEVD